MKRILAIVAIAITVVMMFGCSSGSNQGNTNQGDPEANQAAYDIANATTAIEILAADGDPNDLELSVSFIEAWETDAIKYAIYQVFEDVDNLDWHDTWLLGIANDGTEWKKVETSEPVEAGHKYTQSEIDSFKTLCEFAGDPVDYDAVTQEAQSNKTSSANSSDISFDGKTFTNSDNGMTLTLSELPDEDGYAVSFSDGNVFAVTYDGPEMDNSGNENKAYIDDGFGIKLLYTDAFPNNIYIEGTSRGAQEYAGVYIVE